jgi:1-deoxy-D-xylulose-5-phosphate synthase
MKWLPQIENPIALRALAENALPEIASELRQRIIEVVSQNGGHLGASLGAVELTVALHYIFETPEDRLVWDVGHQTYAHKLLTGRNNEFSSLRKFKGLSPFPKRSESAYDTFGAGHSSTSISAALGMASAAQLSDANDRLHIAVIGDASLASGMAFEALNHLADTNANVLVVLNDNAMGIDKATGALRTHLEQISKQGALFFEALGIPYFGPIDGHDLNQLCAAFRAQKEGKGPRIVHVKTVKGKGLATAEADQVTYHAPGKFEPSTGARAASSGVLKYQDIFAHTVEALFKKDPNIVAVTPAMLSGSGLIQLKERYPSRVFDVGIAEQHAVTFSAGLAAEGFLPICALYSTFAQRAYDQIIHDVALQKLPVLFAIDRAGLVGADGPTHHGLFDSAMLKAIPEMEVFAPIDAQELTDVLSALADRFKRRALKGPVAVRYPRGSSGLKEHPYPQDIDLYGLRSLRTGSMQSPKIALVSSGAIAEEIFAIETLPHGVDHYHSLAIKPLDADGFKTIFERYQAVVTLEDAAVTASFGASVMVLAQELGFKLPIHCLGVHDTFVPHGSVSVLRKELGIDANGIESFLQQTLERLV